MLKIYVCIFYIINVTDVSRSCFFSTVSVRNGNHLVFLLVLISSITTIILEDSAWGDVGDRFRAQHFTFHYLEMIVQVNRFHSIAFPTFVIEMKKVEARIRGSFLLPWPLI